METKGRVREEDLQEWLLERISRLPHVTVGKFNLNTAFDDLGLSSLAAVSLAAELSNAFGIEVDALITWDHPTIGAAARAIWEGLGDDRRATPQ